jgi:hypothetical protein
VGAVVQIDLRKLVVTIYPNMDEAKVDPLTGLAPDGPENWDNDRPIRKLPHDFAL